MGPASYLALTWLIAVLKPLGRILRAIETSDFVWFVWIEVKF